ncbi:MAG: hypothetical protein ABJJ53_09780 [Sulfitobacter sp.]
MLNARHTLCKLVISFALMIAMAASAFGHTSVRPPLSPELAQYVAMGGFLTDICGTTGEQDSGQAQKCEVCRLMGAAILLREDSTAPVKLIQRTRKLTFVAQLVHNSRPLDPTRLSRAPPQA